jgi:radical SAM protein with 4Fe4S-binding SPASM domain
MGAMPLSVSVEPTTSCNLRCPECPSGLRSFTRPTGMMDAGLYRSVLDQLSPWLTNMTLYFQGEPFLHPAFLDMVAEASERGVFTSTSTNGHYLDPEKAREVVRSGLDRLIISIDGVSQDTYSRYRIGGSLNKVLDGARNVVEARRSAKASNPLVIFQFLVIGPNEHQVPDIFRLGKDAGADEVRLKTAQIYDYENGSPLIPKDLRYSRYVPDGNGKWRIRSAWENKCWKMWSESVITWDGRVLPCCFDKDGSHQMGDMRSQTFREIWFGDKYKEFRSSILKSRASVDICRNCTEGLSVWTEP